MSNVDDLDMPCSTLRVWILGLFFAVLIPALNQFFYFRYPSVTISGVRSFETQFWSHELISS